MKRSALVLSVSGLVAIAACSSSQYSSNDPAPVTTSSMGGTVAATPADDLRQGMRRLWEDHIGWTRNFLISAAGNLAGVEPVTQRLLRNQTDIGNAIKPFYGDAAGEQLTALLRGHIVLAAELVTAAKAGNSSQVESTNRRWQLNADSIATFLSTANSANWPADVMRREMRAHLELTLREAQARLRGDWAADIAAYDAVHEHILRLADVLSEGIIRQFPQRVSSSAASHRDHPRD